MQLSTIAWEKTGRVVRLTLNRPGAFNALDVQLAKDLHAAIAAVDADRDVRAVVLTGAGRAFCGGGDVLGFAERVDRDIAAHIKEITAYLHGAISRMTRLRQPVIGAINGVAAGGGLGLALAPDLALAAESARFKMAYVGIGASPDAGSSFFLPRLVGLRRAFDLTLTNRTLSAAEALDWGLVNRVVPDAQLAEEAMKLAAELAEGPTLAFGRVKRLFYASFDAGLETQMEDEAQEIAASSETADFADGVTAFRDKRPPRFQGR
jgi:2-(1,2-epoxy-1,2-dihydrophenyl)acetyl-CoA isomerase